MERILADRFVVEKLVGSGGMGEVYRAKDRVSGEKVAVKLLFASMKRDADRFKQESQLLAEISHPRIVRYVAHGISEGGRPYLAMEWLEGEDLGERLERRGLSLRESITLARRTAEGLGVLHHANVVHRDVKPSNIFLPDNDVDRAKILDLGVARLLHNTRPTTRSGIMVGTPGYMAPEQARGTREIDARADVFALGCVLYECISGRPAFVGENIASLLAKILIETPPSLVDLGLTVPKALDELLMRMLAKNPSQRPANGAAVHAELESFAAITDSPAQRASAPAMRALTAGERRLVCVVMSSLPPMDTQEGIAPFEPTDSSSETMAAQFDPRTLVTSFGADAEILADGTIVATLAGMGGASDQAAQAARCALALRSHLIEASVVLATGLATVTGKSAVGEVIERAAALLASARARQRTIGDETLGGQSPVFLDETTAGLLDMGFDVGGDERGLFIRGLRERDNKARTLLGKPTPFVGRDRELATLEAIFDECADEPVARAVLVTGFPGAGKSRLVSEMVRQLSRRPGVEVWLARGDAMSTGSPFALVARLLRRGAGITGGEPLVVRQQKLRARVARNVPEEDVSRVTEFLGEIASIPWNDADSVQLRAARTDPTLMGDQIRRAFCELVVAETTAAAFVLILEDLHWGDLPSVNLLDAALRAANERSFMVLAVARGEVHDAFPQLWAQRSLQEVRLGPLTRRAGEKLVRDILGDDLAASEVARLLDRAAGNPFYLEELIRAFAEGTGRVIRASIPPPGTVPPPPTSSTSNINDSWSLPTTVLAMVEARLQRLDPMARRVMRAASVFGEAFWRGGVLALTGGQYKSPDGGFGARDGSSAQMKEIDEWLSELTRREIVQRRETSRFELDPEFTFRHAIVRDAAYQMLTPEDQQLGHRLAADWLVEQGEDDSMRLGEHFERGGNRARASTYYGQAAFVALEGNDFEQAKIRADRAIQAGATGKDLGRLQLVLAEASRWTGEHEAAHEHATSAMRALEPRSDEWYVAAAEAVESAMTLGYADEAHGVALRLIEIVQDAPINAARVTATSRIAIALGVVGGHYETATALLAPIEAAADLIEKEPAARAFLQAANVARASWEPDLDRAVREAEEAVKSFEVVGDVRNATRQRQKAGTALSELGAYAEAEAMLNQARADAEFLGLHAVANDAALRLTFVFARTGRFDEATRLANELLQAYAANRDRGGEAHARCYLASVYYFGGRFEDAAVESLRALHLIDHSPPYRAALLGFFSLTKMHQGAPPDEVLTMAKEAYDLLEKLTGIAEGEAVVRIAYAEALHYAKQEEAAKKAVAAARDRLLARAAKITNPAYKRAFLGSVRENGRTFARAGEWLA
ncbi:MAG: protein kinase [Labilithrix sp.]